MDSFLLSRPKDLLPRVLRTCSKCDKDFYVRFRKEASAFQSFQCPFCTHPDYIQNVSEASSPVGLTDKKSLGASPLEPIPYFEAPCKQFPSQEIQKKKVQPPQDESLAFFQTPLKSQEASEARSVSSDFVTSKRFRFAGLSYSAFRELKFSDLAQVLLTFVKRKKWILASLPFIVSALLVLLFCSFYFLPGLYLKHDPNTQD